MKLFLTLTAILTLNSICFSQEAEIRGKIQHAENKASLAYVNIGITNKNIGTVSNSNGKFILRLNADMTESDTITFSHIGFSSKHIPVSELMGNENTIFLKPQTNDLNEVIVRVKTPKPKKNWETFEGTRTHTRKFLYLL